MDLNSLPLFRAMASRMTFLGERQQTLAQNVANVDTPGFVAKDLKAPSFKQLLVSTAATLPMAATQKMHLAGAGKGATHFAVVPQKNERSPDGNAVDLEKEMMKVSETATDFTLVNTLYRQHLGMVKTVLARGS